MVNALAEIRRVLDQAAEVLEEGLPTEGKMAALIVKGIKAEEETKWANRIVGGGMGDGYKA